MDLCFDATTQPEMFGTQMRFDLTQFYQSTSGTGQVSPPSLGDLPGDVLKNIVKHLDPAAYASICCLSRTLFAEKPCRFGLFANDYYNYLRVCGGTDTVPQLYVARVMVNNIFMIGSAFYPQRTLAMLQESGPFRVHLVATFDISDVTGDVAAMHGAEMHVHRQLRDYGGPFHDPPGIMARGSELAYEFPATHSKEAVASLVQESLVAFRNANAS